MRASRASLDCGIERRAGRMSATDAELPAFAAAAASPCAASDHGLGSGWRTTARFTHVVAHAGVGHLKPEASAQLPHDVVAVEDELGSSLDDRGAQGSFDGV